MLGRVTSVRWNLKVQGKVRICVNYAVAVTLITITYLFIYLLFTIIYIRQCEISNL